MRRARAIGVGILMATVLVACGGGIHGNPLGTSGSAPSTASGPAVDRARRDLCHDLLLIQSGFRPESLGRLLPKLREDVAGFVQAKDVEDARAVRSLVLAIERLRRAVIAQRGVASATKVVEAVLAHVTFC